MPSVDHMRAGMLAALTGAVALPMPAFAQVDFGVNARAVVQSGGADARRGRIDRTVVSPFDGTRRIVVQPDGSGGFRTVDASAAFRAAKSVDASPPPRVLPASLAAVPQAPAETFIDIGSLDAPALPAPAPAASPGGLIGTPCAADCPSQQIEFLDIQPYYGTAIPGPAPSFAPD